MDNDLLEICRMEFGHYTFYSAVVWIFAVFLLARCQHLAIIKNVLSDYAMSGCMVLIANGYYRN